MNENLCFYQLQLCCFCITLNGLSCDRDLSETETVNQTLVLLKHNVFTRRSLSECADVKEWQNEKFDFLNKIESGTIVKIAFCPIRTQHIEP